MKVLLFGASGNIGSAIAAELTSRGHSVTGATRSGPRPGDPQEIETLRVDATDAAEVAAAAPGYDAIVSALGPRHGADDDEAIIVGAARGLIDGARRAGVRRIIVVGGAGSLEIAPGVRLVDTPDFPAAGSRTPWRQQPRWTCSAASRISTGPMSAPLPSSRPASGPGTTALAATSW